MKLLFTSDWHIRSDNPICRIDDFQDIQKRTAKQISQIAIDNNAIIFIAGDIFHKAKPNNAQELEIMLSEIFNEITIFFIAGQHDLLYHKMENFNKGSIGVLAEYDNWNHFPSFHTHTKFFNFGQKIENSNCSYVTFHTFVAKKTLPFFVKNGFTAQGLFDQFDYDIFVAGDNHHGFVYEKDNRFVFNPGCITRQFADMKNYKPRVYLFDTNTKKYKTIYLLDDDPTAIDISHLDSIKARDNRIDNFVEKLKGQVSLELSFEDNIKKHLRENNISNGTKEKTLKAIGG